MSRNLVIVESATKAKTIEKILGKDFKVVSCVGHISDLPVSEIGVDIENDFKPKYIIPDEKKQVIKDLKKYVKQSDKVWLASDEDREGEAIAWHLYENLNLNNKEFDRIVFHEITNGPFVREEMLFAPWAPGEEDEVEEQENFLEELFNRLSY